MTKKEIIKSAIEYARKHKTEISGELTDTGIYIPSEMPVSVFMAGSPGAGKTEFSKNLISILEKKHQNRVVRIDSDDLRKHFPEYTEKNSKLFQGAVSILVDKIHDKVLQKKQNFVLDGTLANYEKAKGNVLRSLKKKRSVWIFYVYQKPEIAWKFTQIRETAEGRNIPKKAFIDQFFGAQETINKMSDKFQDNATIFIVEKNFETNSIKKLVEMDPGSQIDQYISIDYTKSTLKKVL